MNENKNKDNNDREKIKVQISNIESFLLKSGYLNQKTFNKNHLDILNQTLNKQDYLSHFEFNEKISFSEASVKHGTLIQSINKIFNTNQSIEDMYEQYLDYTKDIILLNQFINTLFIIDLIIMNFSDIISNNTSITNLINEKLIIYDLSVLDDNNNELKNKIEKIYIKIKEKPTLKGNQVNGNLILLVFFVTMGNIYYIDKDLPDLIELINYFTKYNNIFINKINLSFFLYIFLIININLHINSTKNKKQYLNYETTSKNLSNNNLLYVEFNENDTNPEVNKYNSNIINNPNKKAPFPLKMSQRQYDNKKEYNIPNLYIYDNEDIYYKPEDPSIKLLIFQNYLKLYSFYYLSKNKIKFTINLYIESIHDLLLHISNCKKNNEKKNIINVNENIDKNNQNVNIIDNNGKNLENNKNIFSVVDEMELSKINLTRIDLFLKENMTNCFSGFNFLGLSNFVTGFKNDYQVSRIISINLDLIKKSKKWHLQESVLFKDEKNDENDDYSSTENLINSFSILNFILETFGKNNHLKKNYPYLLLIKFRMFKCTISRDKKKPEIKIYFDYSSMKEKTLFQFLKTSENILFLISKYQQIINLIPEFKQYNCVLRVSQTNFLSHQVNFYFKLIIKIIVDYIDANKHLKIEIYEKQLSNYNPNMLVYIRNNSLNKKTRINQIKQLIHNPLVYNKIKIFQNFIEQLEACWDIIVISKNSKDFQLLRTFDDNKLFIYIDKENSSNIDEKKRLNIIKNSTNLNNSFFNIYEYLNIIMYFKNDQEIYRNGLNFLNLIKMAKQSQKDSISLLPLKTTLICDRFFLESKVIVDRSMKNSIQLVYDTIDDLLLIAKCINVYADTNNNNNISENDSFNYDIYINSKNISVCNYHKYKYKGDDKCKLLIYDFLSVISSCIELIIYILKYKDLYITKFIYIIRTTDDAYYSFEYKNASIFFKKLKEFDSLITFDFKKCYPLLCLLSNKKETEYTESNNNFYDLFLRLFLNLNKVANDKDNLIQIFVQKIHKNIFYQYYDNYILTGFTYEAINYFNDFFIVNNYLEISKGEKFETCNILPIHITGQAEKKNYRILLKKFFDENKKNIMFNKIEIFNYNFSNSYIFKNFNNIIMSFRKVEFYNDFQTAMINSDLKTDYDKKFKYLYIKLGKKNEKNKKIFSKIISFIKKGNCIGYMSNEKVFEDILSEYKKERIKYKSQNVGKRIFQITENAKLDQKFNNNDCIIY